MRLSIQRNDLSRLLAAMKKVVEARNTIPVLSCVKLVADGNRLTATATDLDIEISSSTSIMADVDGGVCVNAKLFDDIVRKMGEDIELELAGATLHIRSGRSKFKLPVLPIADYPSFSQTDFTTEFEYDLAALFGPVRFAISTEETRYYLNGIYIHVDGGKLTAVATDGHRLSRNIGTEAPEFEGVIVPRKMVGIVPPGALKIALSNRKIRLVSDDCTITSKLIDGTFPDYRRVIPTRNDKVAVVDTEAAKASIARVATVGSAVKLSLAAGSASLAVSEDGNTASDEIEIGYSAEPIEIGFSAEYLAELFAVFPPGEVKMALADAGSPALFTSASAEGLLAVLMPRRI